MNCHVIVILTRFAVEVESKVSVLCFRLTHIQPNGMFKRAGNSLQPHIQRLHRQASTSTHAIRRNVRAHPGAVISTSILAAYLLWSNTQIHNDAVSPTPVAAGKTKQAEVSLVPGGDVGDSDELRTVVWGSNKWVLLPFLLSSFRT